MLRTKDSFYFIKIDLRMILLQLDTIDISRVCDTPYIYTRVRACIVIVTLFSVLVGSYILSAGGGTRQKSCIAGQAAICWWNSRTRRERNGRVEKSAKGTGAEQGIINARVSLTSVRQKSSSGLAIERPPGIHRHDDRCVKTISCSPGTLSCLLLSNDSLARSFGDQKREKSCMCKFPRTVFCNFQESHPSHLSRSVLTVWGHVFSSRRGKKGMLNIIINIRRTFVGQKDCISCFNSHRGIYICF